MQGGSIQRRRLLTLVAAMGGAYAFKAVAQTNFPNRPIKIIVPFPAGGAGDTAVRMVTKSLADSMGQQIVVDNKPGGDGVIAAMELLRSAPDGYTLMFGTATPLIYTPLIRASKPPYDPLADFSPVSMFSSFTYFLHVHKSVPAKNIQEFMAYVRSNPGKVAYGTGDSTSIVTMAQMQLHAQLDMTHIPYKGGAQAFADFAAGRIQAMVGPLDLDDKMQGKSHPLAVLQAKRSPLRPDTPTLAEIGFPKVNILAWTGFFAPAKTPQPILEQLSSEMVKVFKRPDLQDTFLKMGSNLEGSTPAALGAILKSQLPVWKEAIQFAKIPVE